MSRTYLGDTDIKNPSGVTITYQMYPSKNCKYCLGRGQEIFITDRHIGEEGKPAWASQKMPCRCIKLMKKDITDVKITSTDL